MERRIKIFKSFEEQESYHLEQMRSTSVLERFHQLYAMQQLSEALHPGKDRTRKLIIKNGRTKS